jgi:hypothetical protein
MDFSGAFDDLVESDFWIEAALVFGGFIFPTLAANVIEARGPDLPNEVYGGATAAGGLAYGQEMVAVGGGVYVVDALAQRVGVKESITSLGGGN